MNIEKMGKLIAAGRKNKGMTQKALADCLNVTDKAVSKWERGLSCPDISLLPRLSELFDVTVEELLNGKQIQEGEMTKSRNEQEWNAALCYANETVKSRIREWRTLAAAGYSALLLIGVVVCMICDVAICGRFTWSLYPLSSAVFAWLVGFPLIQCRIKGIAWSLVALSAGTLPFLYIIGLLTGREQAVMEFGLPITMFTLVYLWGIYVLFRRWKEKKLLASAVAVALGIPLDLAVNFAVARLLPGIPLIDAWDFLSIVCLAMLSVALFLRHIRRKNSQ